MKSIITYFFKIDNKGEKVRGNIYINFIDKEAYAIYLESAIEINEKLNLVRVDPNTKRFINIGKIIFFLFIFF